MSSKNMQTAAAEHAARDNEEVQAVPDTGLGKIAMDPRIGLVLALLAVAAAIAVGLSIPRWIPLHVIEENGLIERATLWAYLTSILGLLLLRWETVPWPDVLAACLLLLAMAAREADLHAALYGISILKARFYRDAPLHQILGALAVLAPVLLSGLWLLRRHAGHWRQRPQRWSAGATTLALMVVAMVVAKTFDRVPATAAEMGHALPAAARYTMQSLEEILELCLPLFALLAMVQARWEARQA
jgi:hypothetical protein